MLQIDLQTFCIVTYIEGGLNASKRVITFQLQLYWCLARLILLLTRCEHCVYKNRVLVILGDALRSNLQSQPTDVSNRGRSCKKPSLLLAGELCDYPPRRHPAIEHLIPGTDAAAQRQLDLMR